MFFSSRFRFVRNIYLFSFYFIFPFSPESVHFLTPDVCAREIVEGVITNQKFLYIPKWYRFLEFIKSFLPYDAFKAILSYVLNIHNPNLKRNRPRPIVNRQ